MNMNKTLATLGIVSMSFVFGARPALADAIPYPTPGLHNAITYTFTAATSGNITAYFAGSTASYVNELTMLVNGTPTGIVGLNNHTSGLGQSLVLGSVNAGDTLVFELINHTLGLNAYSDPSLNVPYDLPGSLIHNHVYSTAYTQTSPIIDSIPAGTYVAFEDLRFPGGDFNYHDETFVFQNVSVSTSVPDGASSMLLLGIGISAIGILRRRFASAV
jgi:hypothetical protein